VLRHASRSVRVVVDEDLLGFAGKHRMSGIILLRPVEPDHKPPATTKTMGRASRSAKGRSSDVRTPSKTVGALHSRKGRR
jgi:hypothetical protein